MQKIFNKKIGEHSGNTNSTPFLQAKSYQLPAASFGLVEVIIGVSVLAVSVVVLFSVILFSQRIAAEASTKIQVALLLQEGAEAMRYIRDANKATWSVITNQGTDNNPKCLLLSNSVYTIGPLSGTCSENPILQTYTRTVSLQCATRDGGGNISDWANCPAGDANTVKAQIAVEWMGRTGIKTENLETIITNR